MSTLKDVSKVLLFISAAYSNFSPNDFTPQVFLQILGDLPAELLEAAVMKCLGEARPFAPSPGEIRAAAMHLQAQSQGVPSAAAAYAEAANMPANQTKLLGVAQDGVIEYARIRWSHPFVERIAKMVGWLSSFPSDNPTADRAQFLKIYDSELQKELQSAYQLPAVEKYLSAAQNGIKQLTEKLENTHVPANERNQK